MTQPETEQNGRKLVHIGGNLEQALKGDYQLDLRAILAEAWHITRRNWGPMTLAITAVFCMTLLGSMLLIQLAMSMGQDIQDPSVLMQSNLLLTMLMAPFMGGIVLMGMRNAVKLPCRANQVFDALRRAVPLALTALLSTLLVNIGMYFLVLPGIFLLVATSLATPLVLEKRLTPLRAILISIRVLSKQWFKLFILYLIMAALFVVALIPMGLGLLWIAPMYFNLKGILYREIFGLQLELQTEGDTSRSSGVFHA